MRLFNLHNRHDGLCHWCAGPTLIDAPPAHPMRATRDHVVARSKHGGGAANVVLACQACNLARASRPGPPDLLRRHGIVQKLLARCAAQQREFDQVQRRKQARRPAAL
jgi:hypothetical protein